MTIELHLHPVPLHYSRLLGTDEMFREARPLRWRGGECLLPAPVHLIVHNFIHAFLHDTRYAMKNLSLRQSFEFALASHTYGNLVDWNAIGQRCKRIGYETAWRQYLTLVHVCFGSSLAPVGSVDWAERMRIEPYLIRMNLESRAVLWVVNFVCQLASRLFVLIRDPGKVKKLLYKNSYLKLRDRVFPPH
ncbi:MAG: nucleotidyltransferase family protein [Candidatus Accumulibacter delftensis]